LALVLPKLNEFNRFW